MNNILSEKEYQHFIMDYLKNNNGYVIRKNKDFDRLYAMDKEMLFKFLNDTQPDEMTALEKIYKTDLEETLVNYLNMEITKKRSSLIEVLKHGINISNQHLDLMYTRPATDFNKELVMKYQKIFSLLWKRFGQAKMRGLTL